MELYDFIEGNENVNMNNYHFDNFSKNKALDNKYFFINKPDNINIKNYKNQKKSRPKFNNQYKGTNNFDYNNNLNNRIDNEDLDIELDSISKIIPLNNFINIDQNNNPNEYIEYSKIEVTKNKKNRIKRKRRANSIFNNTQNNIGINNTINNSNITEINMTNIATENRPDIYHFYPQKEQEKILNNNINNNITIYNNTNTNINTNDNNNDNKIKKYNTVINHNYNNIIENNNEENILNISTKNSQKLYEEIQKLKKENKRLFIKNNELSLKLRTQEAKTKINNNNNNNNNLNHKQKEEFLLQKIKKLENEIIKQKDLITKLTYHKRFNIGIRKIRINSFIIKSNINNNNKLKRRNTSNIYNNKNNSTIHYNNTLPNKANKYIKKRKSNSEISDNQTFREEINMKVKPLLSSTHSSQEKIKHTLKKKLKNKTRDYNSVNLSMNISDVIEYHNKENSVDINFDDDLFKYINNYRENKKIKNIKKNNEKNKNNSFVKERKTCDTNIEEYKIKGNKKIKNNKIKGRTSLIMSVINDNLLGNFEHNNYIKDNSYLYNKSIKNNERPKRNSIY